jgi:hypothetical protein
LRNAGNDIVDDFVGGVAFLDFAVTIRAGEYATGKDRAVGRLRFEDAAVRIGATKNFGSMR